MTNLQGKNCIITGAGHGIGEATARKFLREGARVLACDIVPERIAALVNEFDEGDCLRGLGGDVSDMQCCLDVVKEAQNWFGEIHVLINNVGIASFQPFLEHSVENWQRTLEVNLTSMFYLGQRVAQVMVKQGAGGAVVNMASLNAHAGEAALAAYNASKGGVLQLTRTMAIELAPHDIRVNCVAPGYIDTGLALAAGISEEALAEYLPRIPMQRPGWPDEVANVIAFLASDEASYVTGASIPIDGGQMALV